MAGFSLGAFTLPAILKSRSLMPVAVLGIRVGLFTVLTIAANWLLTGHGSWPAIFFVSNWAGPDTAGGAWFVDVYLQCLVLLAGLLLIPQARHALRRAPFAALAVAAACSLGLALGMDALIDTHHLYRRLPFLLGWVLLCGAAAQSARNWKERAVATAIAATGLAGIFGWGAPVFFVAALLAVIWIPHVRVPRLVATPVRDVATASLAIYLTHFQFASMAEKVGISDPSLKLLLAILGGILVWRIYMSLDRVVTAFLTGISGASRRATRSAF